jgi:hypothetical protein
MAGALVPGRNAAVAEIRFELQGCAALSGSAGRRSRFPTRKNRISAGKVFGEVQSRAGVDPAETCAVTDALRRHLQYCINLNTPSDELITSGPWRVKSYAPNECVVLTRNPYWFGTDARAQRLPYLDDLMFLIVQDSEAAHLKFRAGDVDALTWPAPATVQSYVDHEQGADFSVHTLGPELGASMIIFNLNEGGQGKQPPVGKVNAGWLKTRRSYTATTGRMPSIPYTCRRWRTAGSST